MHSGLRAKLASRNENKLRELARVLADWRLELLDASGYPPEEGATYYENALAKARHGAKFAGEAWVLGEDSGLEVEGLAGAPGCELVALAPSREELRGTGVLEGRIAVEPRGDEGFGYDPIFVPAGEERTVAELGNEWKAENSHRARAARDLLRAFNER
ncbi:MAG: hypothetical protein AUG43_03015 [Actinobacteria bacterium 13_1_20CM_3_68_10]|nr:MAG: hypothetical protein AUG43_03015 [Actinobacteria bacterium 13_1_20CM_3_68_10]